MKTTIQHPQKPRTQRHSKGVKGRKHRGRKGAKNGASKLLDDLLELSKQVPESEWAKVPRDLSYNLDHYLYGAPKKPLPNKLRP